MTHVERLRERIAAAINREMSYEVVVNSVDIPCPVCKARKGKPCTNSMQLPVTAHRARTQRLRLERYRRFADAVIDELGLEPQPHPGPDFAFHRWVTDWVADERG